MVKSVIAVLITWLVGIMWFVMSGIFDPEASSLVSYLVKVALFGASVLVFVVSMPLFIGLVHRVREGEFPHGLFTKLTYVVLFMVSAIIFGYLYYMSAA